MDRTEPTSPVGASVMEGRGYYSANSRPQHAAASVAYPYLRAAAEEVPAPPAGSPLTIGDFGCAGGANEMEPMGLAIDALRRRGVAAPVEVLHTDLPENDFGPLFQLLEGPASYLVGRPEVYPAVVGRTLYGPLWPERALTLGWSGITLHWLSSMPLVVRGAVYPNLSSGAERAALRQKSADDWHAFLGRRAAELVDGGQLVLVAGASLPDGSSGAEALFGLVGEVLAAMVGDATVRRSEAEDIFYPTWNRTLDEWLEPFAGALGAQLEVLDHRLDASDDAATYTQFSRDGDAAALATAYTPFVRAITEHPFFRWLAPDRPAEQRAAVVDDFYRRLQAALTAHPDATAVWHTVSIRVRRRPR